MGNVARIWVSEVTLVVTFFPRLLLPSPVLLMIVRKVSPLVMPLLPFVLFVGYGHCNSAGFQANLPVSVPENKRSVADVIRKVGTSAERRMRPYFEEAGVAYPPSAITLIGLKDEMELELWAEEDGKWVHIHTYDVYAASGDLGPKQKRGDHQVPEGIYQIVSLNPNSNYHLSMKLNYPNSFDRQRAHLDGRSNLGGDIYIHGNAKSVGCIAIGNPAIEELFVLASKVGLDNIRVIIAPQDMRKNFRAMKADWGPSWLPELYNNLGQELTKFTSKKGA